MASGLTRGPLCTKAPPLTGKPRSRTLTCAAQAGYSEFGIRKEPHTLGGWTVRVLSLSLRKGPVSPRDSEAKPRNLGAVGKARLVIYARELQILPAAEPRGPSTRSSRRKLLCRLTPDPPLRRPSNQPTRPQTQRPPHSPRTSDRDNLAELASRRSKHSHKFKPKPASSAVHFIGCRSADVSTSDVFPGV